MVAKTSPTRRVKLSFLELNFCLPVFITLPHHHISITLYNIFYILHTRASIFMIFSQKIYIFCVSFSFYYVFTLATKHFVLYLICFVTCLTYHFHTVLSTYEDLQKLAILRTISTIRLRFLFWFVLQVKVLTRQLTHLRLFKQYVNIRNKSVLLVLHFCISPYLEVEEVLHN